MTVVTKLKKHLVIQTPTPSENALRPTIKSGDPDILVLLVIFVVLDKRKSLLQLCKKCVNKKCLFEVSSTPELCYFHLTKLPLNLKDPCLVHQKTSNPNQIPILKFLFLVT